MKNLAEAVQVRLEQSRMERQNCTLVLNKGLLLYFFFLAVGIIGFINGYINRGLLNVLVVMGLAVLVIGAIPYLTTMAREEQGLKLLEKNLKAGRGE